MIDAHRHLKFRGEMICGSYLLFYYVFRKFHVPIHSHKQVNSRLFLFSYFRIAEDKGLHDL